MSIKLLVSVRDTREATVALHAGVDIIDVKDPSQGPLGFAGTDVIRSVLACAGQTVPVSAALGECGDWPLRSASSNDTHDSDEANASPALRYVKLGLAGMTKLPGTSTSTTRVSPVAASTSGHDVSSQAEHSSSTDDTSNNLWIQQWRRVRQSCLVGLPVNQQTAWVAVAYSDSERAHAPSPTDVLQAAAASKCAVFLLDTFVKDGQTTLDWISEDELIGLRKSANSYGMQFALAGQLTQKHLHRVASIRPDIFAVRGAVCEQQERSQAISGDRIRELRLKLATL